MHASAVYACLDVQVSEKDSTSLIAVPYRPSQDCLSTSLWLVLKYSLATMCPHWRL